MEDKIIAFLRLRGPSLPSDIAKQLKTNTFFAGAHLSTLMEKNQVFVSNVKIGSSPLYYLKDHKYKLEAFAKHLGEKNKKTFEMLKEKKILRDKAQDPLTRVSLRSIKDFSVQLNVNINGSKEIFWKLYSVTDDEANMLIRKILEKDTPKKQETEEKPKEEFKQKPEVEKRIEEIKRQELTENISEKKIQQKTEQPKIQENIALENIKHKQESIKPIQEIKREQKKTEMPGNIEKPKEQIQERLTEEKPIIKGEFYSTITKNFAEKNITITDIEMIKKNKEYDFVVKIPSPAGELVYYCKAKSKKRVNEGDLSSTILKAQSKRLPALFLTEGDLTKKAENSLNEELKDQIKVMKI